MMYQISKEMLVSDYLNLSKEKENEINACLADIDSIVDNKLAEMRAKVYEEVRAEQIEVIEKKYSEKEAFYAKYIKPMEEQGDGLAENSN